MRSVTAIYRLKGGWGPSANFLSSSSCSTSANRTWASNFSISDVSGRRLSRLYYNILFALRVEAQPDFSFPFRRIRKDLRDVEVRCSFSCFHAGVCHRPSVVGFLDVMSYGSVSPDFWVGIGSRCIANTCLVLAMQHPKNLAIRCHVTRCLAITTRGGNVKHQHGNMRKILHAPTS